MFDIIMFIIQCYRQSNSLTWKSRFLNLEINSITTILYILALMIPFYMVVHLQCTSMWKNMCLDDLDYTYLEKSNLNRILWNDVEWFFSDFLIIVPSQGTTLLDATVSISKFFYWIVESHLYHIRIYLVQDRYRIV